MIEAALLFGLIIFAGIGLVLAKLPRRVTLWLLGHHVALDLSITLLTLWVHWGTMVGLMAAATAGLICTLYTSTYRTLGGYTRSGRFVPGLLRRKLT